MIQFDKGLDFLKFIKSYHHKLSEFYNNLSIESDKEKIKIILNYVAEHEKKMERSIENYEEDISPKISETWFQFIDTQNASECLDKFSYLTYDCIDDIINSIIELDECLITIYQGLAKSAPSEDVKTVFENLCEMESHELRKVVHNIYRYNYL